MMPMPGYTSAAVDPRRPTAPTRTLQCQGRGEAEKALLKHGLDGADATELLDFAELNGDVAVARTRVAFDGREWTLDLFGPAREAAA